MLLHGGEPVSVYATCDADCPVPCDGRCRSRPSVAERLDALLGNRSAYVPNESCPEHRFVRLVGTVGCAICADAELYAEWEYRLSQTGQLDESEATFVDQLRAALVDTAGLDAIPEPQPLIRGLLYRDSIAWLIGPPGNGKSFVALDMAGSVGTGEPWQGFPVERGDVLYLIAEGVSGVRPRVRAWESSAGRAMAGVQFLPVAVQAANAGQWDALVQLAAELRPVFAVVDTQARVTVGMEENAAKDMGVFVHRVEQLRVATGACVTVVHHQGRNGEHMRGSTALEGAATTILRVAKDDDTVTVSCSKQKDAAPFDDITLRLIPTDSSAILALTDRPQGTDTDSAVIRAMLSRWWTTHESDEVSVSVLVKSGVVAEATFHRAKKALVAAGIVERGGTGRGVRYRLPKNPGE